MRETVGLHPHAIEGDEGRSMVPAHSLEVEKALTSVVQPEYSGEEEKVFCRPVHSRLHGALRPSNTPTTRSTRVADARSIRR